MTKTQIKTETRLPADPVQALRHLDGIVTRLLSIMEREAMALARQDALSFTAAQEEKAILSDSYRQCAEEFKARLFEFRDVDRVMLDRLDAKQRELVARTKENMAAMERTQAAG